MKYEGWQSLSRLAFMVMSYIGVLLFLEIFYSYESLDETHIKMGVAVLGGLVGLVCYIYLGGTLANMIMRTGRKKFGKHDWYRKDLDELEERVRKLEEKKDP